jgi:hypothetical protein
VPTKVELDVLFNTVRQSADSNQAAPIQSLVLVVLSGSGKLVLVVHGQ